MSKSLWQPPYLLSEDREKERRASWLELFYDLIFVAAIAEVAHYLHDHITISGFLSYVIMFVPIWWSWVGATYYATRFDTENIPHRLLTLLQMVAIAILAINVHDGLGENSAAFALSYVAVRSILIFQYLCAGYFIPVARKLTYWYATGFAIAAIIWLISGFVPIYLRITLWVIALLVDFCTPLTAGKLVAQIPPNFSHIPERLGLFTIIVLGEAVIAVVKGVSQLEWGIASAAVALLGILIAFCLWWIYFDSVDGSPLRAMGNGNVGKGLLWLYFHLPLAIGIAGTGVGVEHIIVSAKKATILPSGDRWLICISLIICLVSLAIIHLITCSLGTVRKRKILAAYRVGSAALILAIAIAGSQLSPVMLMVLLGIACTIQVVLDLIKGTFQPQPES
ncbi:low temperature requirement protein A [Phormidium sp. LEGE 05292]|uniref:low temperature requirement protein A n=1 Tax=[Phormidium] sp. LEGE 05292 TaxID=767427 RepID=UPI001881EE52|nr:low temperature requirement protein A [Phormidium sp. LEGE 05292]MBE9229394.1 low temperature requirement protein A [Phormidium sp. LEGE 05292]